MPKFVLLKFYLKLTTVYILLLFSYIATLRVAGSLQKSTEVMQAMQRLIRVPEVAATMRDLSKEMMKVILILEY